MGNLMWESPEVQVLGRGPAAPPCHGPRITIAIPFYKGRHYLRQAIQSVLRQTNPHWELLICNDHSPEPGIEELVASFPDGRIRYCSNPTNLGMAATWNRCLDLARADLVTLLHADDELLEDYCERMLQAAESYPRVVAFFCQTRIIDAAGRSCFSFPDFIKKLLQPAAKEPLFLKGSSSLASLLRGNFIMCPTMCYRKSLLRERRFAARWRFVQDLDLFSRLLLEGETFLGLGVEAYAYRRHDLGATASYTENLLRFEEEAKLYGQLAVAASARKWRRAARIARARGMIKLNLAYCLLRDLLNGYGRQALQKLRFLLRMIRSPEESCLGTFHSRPRQNPV
jgi:glycosyltransferase involved in cell wall biosynthesis